MIGAVFVLAWAAFITTMVVKWKIDDIEDELYEINRKLDRLNEVESEGKK